MARRWVDFWTFPRTCFVVITTLALPCEYVIVNELLFSFALQEIDTYINHASEEGYSAFLSVGARLLTFIMNIVLTSADKGRSSLLEHLSRSSLAASHINDEDDDSDAQLLSMHDDAADADGGVTDSASAADGDRDTVSRHRRRHHGRCDGNAQSPNADYSASVLQRVASDNSA